MKSVLISIQPKWVELIASGKKTIEVRKTRPKLETPFKCYIYCTKVKEVFDTGKALIWGQEVIGEFVCDKIDISVVELKPNDIEPCYWKLINGSSLTKNELMNYGKYNALYGWHITNLKIYDNPKELREFSHYAPEYTVKDGSKYGRVLVNPITRPPQSWCYVEGE